MKVLVCGGRDYFDAIHLYRKLNEIHKQSPITELVEGGASGADTLARYWAKHNKIEVHTMKVDYASGGSSAFAARDEKLFTDHSDIKLVLGFPTEARGSGILMEKARELGYETRDLVTDFMVG